MMSLRKRKIILWSVMIVLGVCLLFWWVNNFQKNLTGFQGNQFIEGLNLPEIKMPQIPEINYGQQNNQQDK